MNTYLHLYLSSNDALLNKTKPILKESTRINPVRVVLQETILNKLAVTAVRV